MTSCYIMPLQLLDPCPYMQVPTRTTSLSLGWLASTQMSRSLWSVVLLRALQARGATRRASACSISISRSLRFGVAAGAAKFESQTWSGPTWCSFNRPISNIKERCCSCALSPCAGITTWTLVKSKMICLCRKPKTCVQPHECFRVQFQPLLSTKRCSLYFARSGVA